MSVRKEASGRRSVQVEVEVPGTPDQVWQAIATGPGVTAWFVPTTMQLENGVPVAVTSNFGPGMESTAKITSWSPLQSFSAASEGWNGSPPMATEWTVEARAGGKCVVRVIHSLFASTDDWDNQLESTEHGWPSFFRILQIYLANFRGMTGTSVQVMSMTSESEVHAWEKMTNGLGLAAAKIGQQWTAPAGAPSLSGIVEPLGPDQHSQNVLVRLDQPTPGIASFCAYICGGPVFAMVLLYLYGDGANAAATQYEPQWQQWMKDRFPPAATP